MIDKVESSNYVTFLAALDKDIESPLCMFLPQKLGTSYDDHSSEVRVVHLDMLYCILNNRQFLLNRDGVLVLVFKAPKFVP
jgi:hypothetical protein